MSHHGLKISQNSPEIILLAELLKNTCQKKQKIIVLLTLAMETVCCSITSWIAVLSESIILSNSSIQQTPLSASTSAPPSEMINMNFH